MTCRIGWVSRSARQIAAPVTPVDPMTATTRGDSALPVTAADPESRPVVAATTVQ
jgi:hypothetical protein